VIAEKNAKKEITVKLADKTVCIKTEFDRFFDRFRDFAVPADLPADIVIDTDPAFIDGVSVFYAGQERSYIEFNELQFLISHELIPYGVIGIHAVGLKWKGKAWIFTAPSGTGKTTQALNWLKLMPGEAEIISGDKLFLDVGGAEKNGGITVYSCPWKGKENFGRNISAPLGGIVWLSQAKENSIGEMKKGPAAVNIIKQMLFIGNSTDEVLAVGRLTEKLVTSCPVWHLKNLGDIASAELTRRTIEEYEEGRK